MIFLDEVKEAGNYQSFSIYLVFYDMYICVPSYFIDENFTNYFVELMPGRSRLHTNQKLVSLFFSVVEKGVHMSMSEKFQFIQIFTIQSLVSLRYG